MKQIKVAYLIFIHLTVVSLLAYIFIEKNATDTLSPSLPDFSDTYAILIFDNWSGLAPTAPEQSVYHIERSGESFRGVALFAIGGYFADTERGRAEIEIPENIIKSFLVKLSQAQLENGEYEPKVEWTDDYPEIQIRLTYGKSETLEFYSASQGNGNVPWQVVFKGKSYIINSGIPTAALSILKPHLAQTEYQELIDKINNAQQ